MIKIGNIEITPEKKIIAIITAVLVLAITIYVIFFAPLFVKLKIKFSEYMAIEHEVRQYRSIIESAGKVYSERTLQSEEDVSRSIDELAKHGKVKDVKFISINPEKVVRKEDTQYKVLPVEMELESTYAGLGVFLGSLDDLEKTLVKVKSFNISHDKNDPTKFITDLEVEVYLSEK
ncbi:MAG: type 4a pilus biogenesis protein PilO [Candidatus Omnitrophica bacterium]|nr:type 4a pilus biogenesis protein PilO [Candidatus Omnitrophota bacterium]